MGIAASRMLRASQQFKRYYEGCFASLLEDEDLSIREIHVLLFLYNNPGRDTAREVSELRGMPKSQVSAAVDLLTERGFLKRQTDREDRRVVHLTLTASGRTLGREARKLQTACVARVLSPLTETEREQFQALLEKILTGAESKLWEGASQ